jgi:hypothetical protein
MKFFLKRTFEILGYSIKKNYLDCESFALPRDFFPIKISEIQKKLYLILSNIQ